MQFIYLLKPVQRGQSGGLTKAEQTYLDEHVRYVEELARRGVVIVAGDTTCEIDTFTVVVIDAPSEAAARDIMHKDPAVWRGLMNPELHPFRLTTAMLREPAA